MAELIVKRLRWSKPGFRTKLSKHWFAFRKGESVPVLGPFPDQRTAIRERDAHLAKENPAMAEKTTRKETSEETTERTGRAEEAAAEKSDPSDGDGSKETKSEGDGEDE